jgi:hypothetical protein
VPTASTTVTTSPPPIGGSPVDVPSATSSIVPMPPGGDGGESSPPAPPVPSLYPADGPGAMTIRISGAGEVTYPLGPARCAAAGFEADAQDGSATVELDGGTVRIQLAGASSPMTFAAASEERSGAVWSVDGADAAQGSSFAIRASCA